MSSQLTAYIALFSTSGVINLYVCMYVFFRRHQYTDIAYYFMLYTITISIYCFGSALGLTANSLAALKFWNAILYIGMPASATLGLLFAMKYLGMNIKAAWAIPLLSISVITFIMVATNDVHHLHYQVFEIDPVLGAPFVFQEIGYGTSCMALLRSPVCLSRFCSCYQGGGKRQRYIGHSFYFY